MKRSLTVGDGFYIKGLHGALWDFTLQLWLAVQDGEEEARAAPPVHSRRGTVAASYLRNGK